MRRVLIVAAWLTTAACRASPTVASAAIPFPDGSYAYRLALGPDQICRNAGPGLFQLIGDALVPTGDVHPRFLGDLVVRGDELTFTRPAESLDYDWTSHHREWPSHGIEIRLVRRGNEVVGTIGGGMTYSYDPHPPDGPVNYGP